MEVKFFGWISRVEIRLHRHIIKFWYSKEASFVQELHAFKNCLLCSIDQRAISQRATSKQAIWTTRLLESFGIFTSLLLCNNQASIKISENPVLHQRTKHIDIQFHFVREKVSEGKVYIEYVNTGENLADGFIKGLGAIKLAGFRERVLGM
jgi:hypothetical protein